MDPMALVNFDHPSGLICEVAIPCAIQKTSLNKKRFKQLDPFIYIYITGVLKIGDTPFIAIT